MELKDFIDAAAKESVLTEALQNQTLSQEDKQAIADAPTMREKVVAVLKTVHDPEIPVNIWDLGLVYNVVMIKEDSVGIEMTLTAPTCPVAGAIPIEVRKRLLDALPDLKEADVQLVWQPKWNKEMMSEEAQLMLDIW
jgi:metal-sulfur cluster biosynthetic enzyme